MDMTYSEEEVMEAVKRAFESGWSAHAEMADKKVREWLCPVCHKPKYMGWTAKKDSCGIPTFTERHEPEIFIGNGVEYNCPGQKHDGELGIVRSLSPQGGVGIKFKRVDGLYWTHRCNVRIVPLIEVPVDEPSQEYHTDSVSGI